MTNAPDPAAPDTRISITVADKTHAAEDWSSAARHLGATGPARRRDDGDAVRVPIVRNDEIRFLAAELPTFLPMVEGSGCGALAPAPAAAPP